MAIDYIWRIWKSDNCFVFPLINLRARSGIGLFLHASRTGIPVSHFIAKTNDRWITSCHSAAITACNAKLGGTGATITSQRKRAREGRTRDKTFARVWPGRARVDGTLPLASRKTWRSDRARPPSENPSLLARRGAFLAKRAVSADDAAALRRPRQNVQSRISAIDQENKRNDRRAFSTDVPRTDFPEFALSGDRNAASNANEDSRVRSEIQFLANIS